MKLERAAEREAEKLEREALEVKLSAATRAKTSTGTTTAEFSQKQHARPMFDMDALVKTPLKVNLPVKPESPTFVCSKIG